MKTKYFPWQLLLVCLACLLSISAVAAASAPLITPILDQTTAEDTPTGPISFIVTDDDTDPDDLEITAASSNQTLLPDENISLGGSGVNRWLEGMPAADQSGKTRITVTVGDDGELSSTTFELEVTPVNDPPEISNIADQTVEQDHSTGPLDYTVDDIDTAVGLLDTTAVSANPTLVPNENITLKGGGPERSIEVRPAQGESGEAAITVTVDDGELSDATTFVVEVAANTPPTISQIANQTTAYNTPTGNISFTVGDAETDPSELIVTAVSFDPIVVPNGNIQLGGSSAIRMINIVPATGQSGTATIIVTVSDGLLTNQTSFQVTVQPNQAPTISDIDDQITELNTPTDAIPFTVDDAETDPDDLTVTAVSSNQTLVPNSNIQLGGSGQNRTIRLTPARNQFGASEITVTVSDGELSSETVFTFTVQPNQPPSISDIGDRETAEDAATGPIPFTVDDAETDPDKLEVTAVSSNQTLVPNGNISLGGVGKNRTVTVTPAADKNGTATVTVTVDDGLDQTSDDFVLTVTAVNDPPTISDIKDQKIDEDTTLGPLSFTVGDVDNDLNTLVVTAVAADKTLVPDENISISGSGADRTIAITPAANAAGATQITVRVSDGSAETTDTFTLTVKAVNDPPTISPVPDQTVNEDATTAPIPFTIGDIDTPLDKLQVTGASSNVSLLPAQNIVIGGSGANRTVTLTPAANQNGTATVTLTVKDGSTQATTSFTLKVDPVNDAPAVDLNGGSSGTGYSTTFATNGNPVKIADSDMSVSDVDSDQLASATVTIVNRQDGAAEILSANTNGTKIKASYSGGVLTLSGADSLLNYRNVLRSVTYRNTADSPSTRDRFVEVVVKDGSLASNVARSTVAIIDPRITLTVTPSTQTIGSGGTAVFTVELRNEGSVRLTNVRVDAPRASDCERRINRLNVGESEIYSCNRTSVTAEFTNEITVEGRDSLGGRISDSAIGRVEVENPNIAIVKGPETQAVVKGGTAAFQVFVYNTSATVDLVEVEVSDPQAPDCSRSGMHSFRNLAAGEEASYTCTLENVTEAFTNEITIRGRNLLTNEMVEDSSIARVELLALTADLAAAPASLPEPGGLVTFTLQLTNEGSVDLSLLSLTSEQLGNVANLANGVIVQSDCDLSPPPLLAHDGGSYSCAFMANVSGVPPSREIALTAVARDADANEISQEATAAVAITDVPSLDVFVRSTATQVTAPGDVTLFVRVVNSSDDTRITLQGLTDSIVGDLNTLGSCELPQLLPPDASYECAFPASVNGSIGRNQIHRVTAVGITDYQEEVEGVGQTTIQILNPSIRTMLMPVIAQGYAQPDEPNNSGCAAFPILANKTYRFYPDDPEDWYTVVLRTAGRVSVRVLNFVPQDGQVQVYRAPACNQLKSVAFNGNQGNSNRSVDFIAAEPGVYLIRVFNNDKQAYNQAYTLRVDAP